MSPEYKALGFSELCERLTTRARTLIVFHDRPDGDAAGSAFGLRALLEALGSETRCVCSSEVHPRYRFAVEELCDSVLPENLPADFVPERVVSVDTASPAQMKELDGRLKYKVDIMIDHHGRGEPYADYYVDGGAAACGEIIYDIAQYFLNNGKISKLPERFALLTYMAIATDTGCFKYSNTTPETHRRAAALMDGSFDYAETNFRLFDSRSKDELKVSSAAMQNMRFYFDGKLAIAALDYAQILALGVPSEYYDGLISAARSVEGVEVAVAVRRMSEQPVFRVSTRSNGAADVSELCAKFGGGGHSKAAGCSINAKTLEEAIDMIVSESKKFFK
ncbi:MAG: bifunctional oligoribonuclease/PAP phosphatase NrnA [Clostridia bacterium]|nr:bifunctional oligoribonuclease/PAP phosphatase NrnA [Clostridia bacterium]